MKTFITNEVFVLEDNTKTILFIIVQEIIKTHYGFFTYPSFVNVKITR